MKKKSSVFGLENIAKISKFHDWRILKSSKEKNSENIDDFQFNG